MFVELTVRQKKFLVRVIAAIEEHPVETPSELDLARSLGIPMQAVVEIVRLGVMQHEIVRLADGVLYTPGQLEAIRVRLRDAFGQGAFAPREVRNLLGTTRRYADAFLSHFDREGVTTRGDEGRVLAHL